MTQTLTLGLTHSLEYYIPTLMNAYHEKIKLRSHTSDWLTKYIETSTMEKPPIPKI